MRAANEFGANVAKLRKLVDQIVEHIEIHKLEAGEREGNRVSSPERNGANVARSQKTPRNTTNRGELAKYLRHR